MTDESIRVAVAKCLGWVYPGSTCLILENWRYWIPPLGTKGKRVVPDYPNDLNACAEMERSINEGMTWCRYYNKLDELCEVIDCDSRSAPPRQRCEAYLRTVGLWKEEA